VWARDLTRDEFAASARWGRLFGFPAEGRLRLEDFLGRVHPEDTARVRQAVERVLRGNGRFELEHRVLEPGGAVRWIYSMGQVDRESGHVRGVSLDLTRRKQIEAEANQQRNLLAHLARVESLGVLSGSLAHELSHPLGVILSNAQAAQRMLARGNANREELAEILDDIVREDRRAGEVIKRLRAMLRRGESQHQPTDINEVIGETLQLVGVELSMRGIRVRFVPEDGLPAIPADRVQLQQVLLNLIMNAADAMQELPREERALRIEAVRANGRLQLSVSDQGHGLPSDPESIFAQFHSTKPQGLGLGLTICRTIVEAHRGRIWAEPAPGRGAVFRIDLPEAREVSVLLGRGAPVVPSRGVASAGGEASVPGSNGPSAHAS